MTVHKNEILSSDPAFDKTHLQRFKDQLLIVLLKRLGGEVTIPIAEVDATGNDLMAFELVGAEFRLTLRQKS
jgi:hypothetical protein